MTTAATSQIKAVSEGHARTVAGSGEGFCDANTSTTNEYVDLTAYAGRYVKIYCESADHYFTFSSATGKDTVLTGSAVGTDFVPDRVDQGGAGVMRVVPADRPWLTYRTVSGTGVIRVIPV